jgi:hypothetical protein
VHFSYRAGFEFQAPQKGLRLIVSANFGARCGAPPVDRDDIMRRGTVRALGKSSPRAGWIETAEAPAPHTQHHRPALPEQIMQRALAATVDAIERFGAGRARSDLLIGDGKDRDLVRARQGLVDCQGRWDQRQNALGQRELSITGVSIEM